MDGDSALTSLDGIVLAILIIAVARGVFIGLVRESFSIAALAAAVIAIRYATNPAGDWLHTLSGSTISPQISFWIAGGVIAVCTVILVALVGRIVRKGLHMAGLSWADRIGGAAIGASEGLIIAMLLVLGATWAFGRDHPVIAQSRSLEAYDQVRTYLSENESLPNVATPGDWI
ncbi:MAG: CvpA family protein [Myxococcota bacterium]